MTLLVLLIVLYLTFVIYKRTRSYVWAILAFVFGMIVVPMVIDQTRLLLVKDKVVSTAANPNTNPSAANSQVASRCNCN